MGLLVWDPQENHFDFAPTFWANWGNYGLQEGTINRERVRAFADLVTSGDTTLGHIMVDSGMMSLTMTPEKGSNLLQAEAKEKPDTVVYFDSTPRTSDRPTMFARAKAAGLEEHYCLSGTTICLFTNRTQDELGPYTPMLAKKPPVP